MLVDTRDSSQEKSPGYWLHAPSEPWEIWKIRCAFMQTPTDGAKTILKIQDIDWSMTRTREDHEDDRTRRARVHRWPATTDSGRRRQHRARRGRRRRLASRPHRSARQRARATDPSHRDGRGSRVTARALPAAPRATTRDHRGRRPNAERRGWR